jgi:hypothetical protein
MGTRIVTFAADASTEIARCIPRLSTDDGYSATVFVNGTWGSGTFTITASPDGGTTKVAIKDIAGAAFSLTANGVGFFRIPIANVAAGSEIRLYGNLAGSTTPALTVTVFDNT